MTARRAITDPAEATSVPAVAGRAHRSVERWPARAAADKPETVGAATGGGATTEACAAGAEGRGARAAAGGGGAGRGGSAATFGCGFGATGLIAGGGTAARACWLAFNCSMLVFNSVICWPIAARSRAIDWTC